ncbi:MAG: hypothetical protein ACK5CH_04180, partial [Bacteroidota bacterium]
EEVPKSKPDLRTVQRRATGIQNRLPFFVVFSLFFLPFKFGNLRCLYTFAPLFEIKGKTCALNEFKVYLNKAVIARAVFF